MGMSLNLYQPLLLYLLVLATCLNLLHVMILQMKNLKLLQTLGVLILKNLLHLKIILRKEFPPERNRIPPSFQSIIFTFSKLMLVELLKLKQISSIIPGSTPTTFKP